MNFFYLPFPSGHSVLFDIGGSGGEHSPIIHLYWYSEWGMRGWSVLGSVLFMGSGALVWSLLITRWVDSKLIDYFLYIEL